MRLVSLLGSRVLFLEVLSVYKLPSRLKEEVNSPPQVSECPEEKVHWRSPFAINSRTVKK